MTESGKSRLPLEPASPSRPVRLFLTEGVVVDPAGNYFLTDPGKREVCKLTPDGAIVVVVGPPELSVPAGLAVDPAGHLFIADSQNHRVLRVGPDGSVTIGVGTGLAGFSGDGGPATAARLNEPWGLAVDRQGQLFIADAGNHRVRQVAPDGTITTAAGVGRPGFSGDGGPATAAELDRPLGVAVDSGGNLFIVDSFNGRIRKIDGERVIRTVFGGSGGERGAGPGSAGYYPARVAVDGEGNLWVADPFRHRLFKVVGVAAPGMTAGRR